MKLKPSTKKLLLCAVLFVAVVGLSGCRILTDETGAIKQIMLDTSFQETFATENWFNAILVWPMATTMNHLAPKIGVLGAIAVVTIVVNLILMALTMKSTIAQQQMQLLQPEMDRIQRKYEGKTDDASRQKQAMEMQKLYNTYGVNPMSMILVTFVQFPVIIAMYQAVQRSVAVQTGSVFGAPLAVRPLDGIRAGNMAYLAIFLIMALCQFGSMKVPQMLAKQQAEKEAAKKHRSSREPEKKTNQTQMMQYYMMAMILVFGLMWPSAMAVYWAVNSLVMIVKTYAVQAIINNRKEAAR